MQAFWDVWIPNIAKYNQHHFTDTSPSKVLRTHSNPDATLPINQQLSYFLLLIPGNTSSSLTQHKQTPDSLYSVISHRIIMPALHLNIYVSVHNSLPTEDHLILVRWALVPLSSTNSTAIVGCIAVRQCWTLLRSYKCCFLSYYIWCCTYDLSIDSYRNFND